MTRTELKVALKLYHDWKVNFRTIYATILMQYTDGKILSLFESAVSEAVAFNHLHGVRDYEINWHSVYIVVCQFMRKVAWEVSNGEV